MFKGRPKFPLLFKKRLSLDDDDDDDDDDDVFHKKGCRRTPTP